MLERRALAEMPLVPIPIGWWAPVPSTTPASPGCFSSSVRVLEEERKTGIFNPGVITNTPNTDNNSQTYTEQREVGPAEKCYGAIFKKRRKRLPSLPKTNPTSIQNRGRRDEKHQSLDVCQMGASVIYKI